MESKIHEKSAVAREIEIFVDEAELQEAFNEAYRELRPKLSLPGFRPGKAPLGLLKKMHGDAIEGDALEKLAQEKFREAVEANDLKPIGMPVMTDLHRHTGEGAHFRISYEIAPEFELQEWNGMEAEKPVYAVTDEDVEERIHRIRFSQAERKPAELINDLESVVTLTIEDAEAAEGAEAAKSDSIEVYLNDPEVLPEIKDSIIGMRVGDVFEATLPKTVRKEEVSTTEKGRVKITINSIEQVTLPELTEDFIKQISGDKVSNEDDLRTEVRSELEKMLTERSNERFEENIVQQLLERHEFEVPRTITHAVIDQLMEEYKEENTRRGFPATYGLEEKEFRKRWWPTAEARAKWMILRDKIIDAEKLEITDEDLEKRAQEESEKFGLPWENLFKYYKKSEQLQNRMLSDKLSALLRDRVTTVEKQIEKAPR